MKKNKIALIDGYGFVFRAFHSLPPLTRNDGTPVGAVYGFTNMLIRLLAGLDVSHIAVVFDAGSKTFRHEICNTYKANRPPCPPELIPQFPLVREVAESLNIHILEKVGFEADDLIATVAKNVRKEDFDVVIVSSDKDLMQLVDDHIVMFDAMKNKMISRKEVAEKFAVEPEKVLDVLSLMGDASDNVPGIKGIGPKTAAELINHYGTLENLLNNIDEIKQDKRRELLRLGVESAKLSKKLITLDENAPIEMDMKDFTVKNIDPEKLISFLEAQGFKSLVARVQKEFKIDSSHKFSSSSIHVSSRGGSDDDQKIQQIQGSLSSPPGYDKDHFEQINKITITKISELKKLAEQTKSDSALIIDIEFDFKNNPETIILSSASADHDLKSIFYIPLNNKKFDEKLSSESDLFSKNNDEKAEDNFLSIDDVIPELSPLLTDPYIIKIGYQIKELIKFFAKNNIILNAFDDVALMAYVLNSGSEKSDLHNLIITNLTTDIDINGFGTVFEEIAKEKIPTLFADIEKKKEFYFFKNYALWKLYNGLKHKIFTEKLNLVYYRFERPLIKVLADMEMNGILIDKIKLKYLSEYFLSEIKKLSAEIFSLAGEEFNIGSPKQLSHILFEKLSLRSGKKSKAGRLSTGVDILEELDAEGNIIAGKILEWRHLSKLKSTYSDALLEQINSVTGRIHSNFSNTSVITGRLSSSNPNLQNIPIKTTEGLKIRQAFIAKKNHRLISADYSQIELRILAHIADIANLRKAFLEEKDIHTITASQIFNVPESQVDSQMRRKAKAINFGIIYGISAFGLSRQLKIPRSDSSNYINAYFATYPGIQDYMSKYREMAKEKGFVTTITGRKCFLTGINSSNQVIRGLAERLAINAPIQGSAADIIKKAMIDLPEVLREKKLSSKLILQVHDELILEVPEDEVDVVSTLLKTTMENAVPLSVPIKVDIKVGSFWGE